MVRGLQPVVVLLGVVLLGCGGEPAPQTKEGFISAADGVCQNVAVKLAEDGEGDPRTASQIARANTILADRYGELADELAKVQLPATQPDRREAEAFVASVRAADPAIAKLRAASDRFLTAAQTQNARALTRAGTEVRGALDAFRAARAQSDALAIQYGLNLCGNLN